VHAGGIILGYTRANRTNRCEYSANGLIIELVKHAVDQSEYIVKEDGSFQAARIDTDVI